MVRKLLMGSDEAEKNSAAMNMRWVRSAGWWVNPSWPTFRRLLYNLYTAVIFVLYWMFTLSMLISSLTEWHGIDTLLANVNVIAVNILSFVKIMPFLFSKGKVCRCLRRLTEMECVEARCASAAAAVAPAAAHAATARRVSRRVSWLLLSVCLAPAAMWAALIIVAPIPPDGCPDEDLPVRLWLPFTPPNTVVRMAARLVISAGLMESGIMAIVTNSLYWTLLRCATEQFSAVCEELLGLSSRMRSRTPRAAPDEVVAYRREMADGLRHVVRHHQAILRYIEELQNLIGLVVFAQCLGNLVMLCGITFLAAITTDAYAMASLVGFLVFDLSELALFCFAGTNLTLQSRTVADAAFDCGWEDYAPPFKSSLRFMMMRAQKPSRVTAMGFATLSLPLFMSLVRASYSYYAVLNQLHEDQ